MSAVSRTLHRVLGALILAAGCCAALAGTPGAAATSPAPGTPAAMPTRPGCPPGMRFWMPHVTAMPPGDPQALAPANLSHGERAAFGSQAGRILAGHHIRWLRTAGCGITRITAGPAPAAARLAPGRGPLATAEQPAQAEQPAKLAVNWSGYQSEVGYFTGVSMAWDVPAVSTAVPNGHLSIWPGIGEGADDTLIQAGTETDADGSIYAWTEILPPQNTEVLISDFAVHAGDNMAVNVGWDPATYTAAFLVVDYTTGVAAPPITETVKGASSGDTAEWIVERSETDPIYPPLTKFGTEAIVNGAADQTIDGSTTVDYIGQLSDYYPLDMTDCSGYENETGTPALAVPSANVDSEGDFTDTWENGGPPGDPVECEWFISPSGAAFSATAGVTGEFSVTDSTAGLVLTCSSATLSGKTGDTDQYAVPASLATITSASLGCTDPRSDSWSASIPSGTTWDLNADTGSTDGVTTGDLSGIALQMTGTVSSQSCAFQLTGSAPEGDVTYTNSDADLGISAATLTVSHVTGAGCATIGIHNADTATMSASLTTSPSITVTP